ncbi:NAD-dependent epimerase/dehydratase family protein [bacterium]|nr:NAD-dependent epimerase/dehydratase family protein [bacterium]
MKILIIGGTIFLGRHLVEVALKRKHEVTIFNRGIHNADLFSQVQKLRGDRKENLEALKGQTFDAVIDTCGYVPKVVKISTDFLKNSAAHYTFISSVSVYADFSEIGIDENSNVATLKKETEEITGETYGALKFLCEKVVEEAFPNSFLNIRPGLIVGEHDPTDRFTYFPSRIAKGGKILVPNLESLAQFIDVKDLAEWILAMVEKQKTGTFNATNDGITFGELVKTCKEVSKSNASFVPVSDEFLVENEVEAYSELPLWVPKSEGEGFNKVNSQKAVAEGLKFRTLTETVRETLVWEKTREKSWKWRAGLSEEREKSLLLKWENCL